jgi:3-hydroxybutyryl-CoA dehydratase
LALSVRCSGAAAAAPETEWNMDEARLRAEPAEGLCLEDLAVGMTARFARTVTEADLVLFAGLSGDSNPVHMDETYARGTVFKGRIAHGMLSAAFGSTAIGTKLPGPGTIYCSQNLRFKAPVRIGDTVEARVTVTDIVVEKRRVSLRTTCSVGDIVVIDGDAEVMVPRRQ